MLHGHLLNAVYMTDTWCIYHCRQQRGDTDMIIVIFHNFTVQGCGFGQKASTSDPSKARCPDKSLFHCYYGHATHHFLPSIAVSDDIGAFVLGKARSTQSVLDTGGAQCHPVNDSRAACPLTSTCVPLQRLKIIPHSYAVGLHRQEQWHH